MPMHFLSSPADASRRPVTADRMVDVINHLPHLPRLVLVFAYCEGMTIPEIGRVLGMAERQVRLLHDDALQQLQLALAC
jgi:DNA-directed RNA polymerase specialized sigma subunit